MSRNTAARQLIVMPIVLLTDTSAHSMRTTARSTLVSVIFGGLIMGMALGIRHVQGLFLVPMTIDRGWSRETFAFAMAMQNLCWGLAQPFTGMVADRFGSARVIAAGTLLYCIGLVLMAHATTPLGITLGGGVVIGVALSCTTFGVIYGALSRVVSPDRRSWALGLAGAVGGLGQFVMVPFSQELQQWFGWSATLVLFGIAVAAAAPMARALRDARPKKQNFAATQPTQSMGAAIQEAFRHRGFWLLNAGFLACGFQLAFIASHLPAYLLDNGLSPRDGVAGLAIIALANVGGTYAFGSWGGIYRRKYLLAGLYVARSAAIAAFLLVPISAASTYAFCAVMGFLWLGTAPLTNGLVSGVFGVRYVTTLFGFVFFGHQLGGFLGVWLGGYVYDVTHSYQLIWIVSMSLGVVAAVLHLMIDDQPMLRSLQLRAAR